MTRYVLKRLVLLPALLFLFSVTVFAIVQAPPGDFLTTYVATLASSGSSISAEQVDALGRRLPADRGQLRRRGDAQFHAGAGPHVGRLRLLRHIGHGAVLARLRGGAVERCARARPSQARLAPRGRSRRGRNRAADAGD